LLFPPPPRSPLFPYSPLFRSYNADQLALACADRKLAALPLFHQAYHLTERRVRLDTARVGGHDVLDGWHVTPPQRQTAASCSLAMATPRSMALKFIGSISRRCAGMCCSSARLSASIGSTGRAVSTAPSMTRLAMRGLPSSSAVLVAGISSISMSVRALRVGTSEEFTASSPPGATSGSYFSNDGRSNTSATFGERVRGEPIGRSLIPALQWAEPTGTYGP